MQRGVQRLGFGLAFQTPFAVAGRFAEHPKLHNILQKTLGGDHGSETLPDADQGPAAEVPRSLQRQHTLLGSHTAAAADTSISLDDKLQQMLEDWPRLSRLHSTGISADICGLEGTAKEQWQRELGSPQGAGIAADAMQHTSTSEADRSCTVSAFMSLCASHSSPPQFVSQFGVAHVAAAAVDEAREQQQVQLCQLLQQQYHPKSLQQQAQYHQQQQQQQEGPVGVVKVPFQEIRRHITKPFVSVRPLGLGLGSLLQPNRHPISTTVPAAAAMHTSLVPAAVMSGQSAARMMLNAELQQQQHYNKQQQQQQHGMYVLQGVPATAAASGSSAVSLMVGVGRGAAQRTKAKKVHSSTRARRKLHSAQEQYKALTAQLADLTTSNQQLRQRYNKIMTGYDASLTTLLALQADAGQHQRPSAAQQIFNSLIAQLTALLPQLERLPEGHVLKQPGPLLHPGANGKGPSLLQQQQKPWLQQQQQQQHVGQPAGTPRNAVDHESPSAAASSGGLNSCSSSNGSCCPAAAAAAGSSEVPLDTTAAAELAVPQALAVYQSLMACVQQLAGSGPSSALLLYRMLYVGRSTHQASSTACSRAANPAEQSTASVLSDKAHAATVDEGLDLDQWVALLKTLDLTPDQAAALQQLQNQIQSRLSSNSSKRQQPLDYLLHRQAAVGGCQAVAAAGSCQIGMEKLWKAEEIAEDVITTFEQDHELHVAALQYLLGDRSLLSFTQKAHFLVSTT